MLLSGSIAIVSWQLQHWILSSRLHFSLCLTIHKSHFYVSRLKARSGKLDANWLPICIWFFCFEGYIDWKLSCFTENMIILSLFASFLAIIINLLQNVQIIVLYFTDYCNIWNTWESWFQASFTTDSANVVLLIIFTISLISVKPGAGYFGMLFARVTALICFWKVALSVFYQTSLLPISQQPPWKALGSLSLQSLWPA